MVRACRFVFASFVLGVCGCVADGRTDIVGEREAVVYDMDDRMDVYAHPDPELRRLARESIVAFVPRSNLDATDPTNIVLTADTLEEAFGVCPDERFAQQRTAADCSGTLISEDLVLTVGHCVASQTACRSFHYVFGYMLEAEGELGPITADDVYACAERVAYSARDDYAVLRLDRPVTSGRGPAPIRAGQTVLAEGTPLTMIGFGVGLPAKIDDGGQVLEDRGAERSFVASVDAFGGNSGSGVFDVDGRVVGMLSSGLEDFVESPDGAECMVVNQVSSPSVIDFDGETVVHVWAAMHGLCRAEPELAICGDAASWCSNCGGGGCAVRGPGRSGRAGVGWFTLSLVGLVAWRRRRS